MKKTFFGLLACLSIIGSARADEAWIHDYLTQTPNFPIEGVNFLSYEKLLKDPKAFHHMIGIFAEKYKGSDLNAIVGLDSRGFIFGAALAYEMGLPFVMVRKAGKLPGKVERIDYSLEYGKNAFEIQADVLNPQDKVLIIDDVLATGGTAAAAAQLVERLGAEVVEFACLIELPFLNGRNKLACPVFSLLSIND